MTTLIYRGVTYTPTIGITARTPKDLIYRGVRHDGMPRKMPRRAQAVEMCYRGVHYTMAPDPRLAASNSRSELPAIGVAVRAC